MLPLSLGFSVHSVAQDQTNFTQFYLNPYILNASYAGIEGRAAIALIYRRQWMNINGSPAIANLSLHAPINTKTAVGLSVTNDKRGILNNSALLFSFGYSVAVNEHAYVRFGMSAGGTWNNIDVAKLDGVNDQAIARILNNHASLSGNAGVSFHSKLFHAGISIPSIFAPSIASEDGFTVSEINPFQTTIIHASNRFYFNKNKNVFEPYVIYRYNTAVPSQFEVAGLLHLNHMVWVGASYKQDFGISAVGGVKLKNSLAIGGSYSVQNSGENQLNSPSFEISINYLFGQRKKGAPVYSFVNTVKEKEKKPVKNSTSEALAQKHKQEEITHQKQLEAQARKNAEEAARKKQEEDLLRKKQDEALALKREEARKREEAHKAEMAKIQQAQKQQAPPAVKHDSTPAVVTHHARFKQEMSLELLEEGHPEHEQEQLSRLEAHAKAPAEHHDGTVYHPHAERHEFVKKGSHEQELDISDYVIGGVFKSPANAKHFSEGLDKLGFNTHYGHLTEKSLWYVYIYQTTDIDKARAQRDKVRKTKILRDAWLLTVHH